MDNYLIQLRDKALQKIQVGITKFNQNDLTLLEREAGYNLAYNGINDLVSYYKQETNTEIKNMLKPKISAFLDDATNMKKQLDTLKQNQAQNQPQNNANNNKPNQQQNKANDNQESGIKEGNKEGQKFENALSEAIVTEKPNIHWDDVAGLENAKKALHEAVILPMKFPDIFTGSRKPWKGILLYGPPGTGKTFLAKACATECNATFFSISSSDLISKWVGESEKLIKTLFRMAREKKPSIIFIDEIDSMTGNRSDGENDATRRVKTEFLVQMEGVGNDDMGILVLGATNIPWGLDPAIRRRFEKRIMIPLPEKEARISLLKNLLKKTPNDLNQDEIHYIADKTEGFSGADLSILIRDASYEPLRIAQRATSFKQVLDKDGQKKWEACAPSDPEGQPNNLMNIQGNLLKLSNVTLDHFEVALSKCKPSVSPADLEKQIQFTQEFGQEG